MHKLMTTKPPSRQHRSQFRSGWEPHPKQHLYWKNNNGGVRTDIAEDREEVDICGDAFQREVMASVPSPRDGAAAEGVDQEDGGPEECEKADRDAADDSEAGMESEADVEADHGGLGDVYTGIPEYDGG